MDEKVDHIKILHREVHDNYLMDDEIKMIARKTLKK